MPISMQRFESRGSFPALSEIAQPAPAYPFQTQCHYCGFDCSYFRTPPRICPKCGGSAWERIVRPRSLLVSQVGPSEPLEGLPRQRGVARRGRRKEQTYERTNHVVAG